MRRRTLAALGLAAGGAAWWAYRRRARAGELRGEVMIVTGGSRGLGYLIARELLRQGCRVMICARDEDRLERARERLTRETGGTVAVPHLLPYDAAKFAAVGLSEGLQAELAGSGVRVTTVIPGLMRTGSPSAVEFRGRPRAEFLWFAAGDLLPFSSMSAERAAARIVLAIRRGERELTLTLQAVAVRRLKGLAPGVTRRLLAVAGRLLPDAGPRRRARGDALVGTLPGPLRRGLRSSGRTANQPTIGRDGGAS